MRNNDLSFVMVSRLQMRRAEIYDWGTFLYPKRKDTKNTSN